MAVSAAISRTRLASAREARKVPCHLTVIAQPPAGPDDDEFVEQAHRKSEVMLLVGLLRDSAELGAQKRRSIFPKGQRYAHVEHKQDRQTKVGREARRSHRWGACRDDGWRRAREDLGHGEGVVTKFEEEGRQENDEGDGDARGMALWVDREREVETCAGTRCCLDVMR
jgi:hypothetical protein